jgi:hypothetical protein
MISNRHSTTTRLLGAALLALALTVGIQSKPANAGGRWVGAAIAGAVIGGVVANQYYGYGYGPRYYNGYYRPPYYGKRFYSNYRRYPYYGYYPRPPVVYVPVPAYGYGYYPYW